MPVDFKNQFISKLLLHSTRLALAKKVRLKKISQSALRRTFSQCSAYNKHQIAVEIGKRFPELSDYVPPVRKPWMSEDTRMSIFEAIAFALVLFHCGTG